MTALYDAALAPAGIGLAQFSLLRNIGRHGPLSLTGLAEIVALDRSTLGRNLRVLERAGLVGLERGADQREATAALSQAGQLKLQQALPLWEDAQLAIHTKLGTAGVAQLDALLGAL